MRLSISLLYLILVAFSKLLGQSQTDTSATTMDSARYEFHPNFDFQEGYGVVVGLHGNNNPNLMSYELGFAKTILADEGAGEIYACTELDDFDDKLLYGFSVGVATKSFLEFGGSLNYLTNFSGTQSFSFRPFVGLLFTPVRSLYCEFGYDISLAKSNFDIGNHWLIGVRYVLGILERKKYGT